MRDYGIEPTIWGGDDSCEHSWGDYIRKGISGGTKSEKVQIKGEDNFQIVPDNNQSYCTHCSAWRGTLGLESHPSMFITHLVEIFSEVRRVLKDTGSVWLNLGDTYMSHSANSKNVGGFEGKQMEKNKAYKDCRIIGKKVKRDKGWLQDKQLMLLPHRVAIALQDDGWCIRNDCVWYKRNPMPSSVKDRFNVVKEYMFFMVKKSKGYWFDLDAVREEHSDNTVTRCKSPVNIYGSPEDRRPNISGKHKTVELNPAGKNPGDIFHLSTESFPDAHFATFPTKLITKPILATCPAEICNSCGQARVRIVDVNRPKDYDPSAKCDYADQVHPNWHNRPVGKIMQDTLNTNRITIGWTTCSCPSPTYSPGTVLDIFGGAGTTAIVAKRNNRNYILIEAKLEYCNMAIERIKKDGRELQYKMEQNGQENLFK